ncbi:hypothetical protein [Deinococcus aestuarii]|nr:hypothetical protein [Deinococcus aestuarii]
MPITLGSDAHRPGHVAAGFPEAVNLLERVGSPSIAHFEDRKRFEVPLW